MFLSFLMKKPLSMEIHMPDGTPEAPVARSARTERPVGRAVSRSFVEIW